MTTVQSERGVKSGGVWGRREFVQAAIVSAGAAAALGAMPGAALGRIHAHNSAARLKVGVIGCGGRGTGAAVNILEASPDVEIHALGDMFRDHMDGARSELAAQPPELASRANVPDERCFLGFDAYQRVLALKPDIVILATPPGFRPMHFAAAIEANCHVFFEKPVAVDPAGVRTVLEAAARASERKLSVVTGTQRRHEMCYLEAMKRIHDGAIGQVVGATVYWNQEGLWMHQRRPEWSDMEWQLRNWLYFTWLSGDHITEQHVHNLDVAAWALGQAPVRCTGMGGRQSRTSAEYGHIYDHFAIEFEYPDGVNVSSQCRQIVGCSSRVEEIIHGSAGHARLSSGSAEILGPNAWKFQSQQTNPYVQEHIDLIASITGKGAYVNEGQRIAQSTMMSIMGRMSAYTGKGVTWEQAMQSRLDLRPPAYEFGEIPMPEVAMPGKTALI